MFKLTPMTSKISHGHSSSNLHQDTPQIHPWHKFGPNAIFVELSCLQAKIANFHVEIDPMTSKNSSRSSIFELKHDTPEIHPWYKFGPNVIISPNEVFGDIMVLASPPRPPVDPDDVNALTRKIFNESLSKFI